MNDKVGHERILIALALCLCAGIICYNYFFIPSVLPPTVIYADKSEDTEESVSDKETKSDKGKSEKSININTASAEELADALPKVGKVTAGAIVSYRETNGPFEKIEDIKNVKGIGDKTFDKIKDLICV